MLTYDRFVSLSKTEQVAGRPFADPAHNAQDVAAMRYMAQALRDVLRNPGALPREPRPFVMFREEPAGGRQRMVFADVDRLLASTELVAVGFFGYRQTDGDWDVMENADEKLIAQFPSHPYVASYSTYYYGDGNAGNLAIMSHLDGIEHWRTNAIHQRVTQVLSPQYYRHIRLHCGVLPGGLLDGNHFNLHRTKYYEFEGDRAWLAVREASTTWPFGPNGQLHASEAVADI